MNRKRGPLACLAILLCVAASPVRAADLLDYVIQAIDPTLAPARPLIECLAGGGSAEACALETAKQQARDALPIGPADDRVQKAAQVFAAARDGRWVDVVRIGGEVVAKSVSCAVLPLSGPVKGAACSIIGWVISKGAGTLDRVFSALQGPDWWALVEAVGTGVCNLIPGDGAAGFAKDMLCGGLAAILLGAKRFAESIANAVAAGADALESALMGDDSHMPQERYYALYWQPWYQYSTAQVMRGAGPGRVVGEIYDGCVNYFDSHNQYRSTARETCGAFKRNFTREVKGFAAALPVAVDGYFESVTRPAIRAVVLANYGKPSTGGPLPGQELFVRNCAFTMHQRFPFPEPSDAHCRWLNELANDPGNQYPITTGAYYERARDCYRKLADDSAPSPYEPKPTEQECRHLQELAQSSVRSLDTPAEVYRRDAAVCFRNVARQNVTPPVWQSACEQLRPRYQKEYANQAMWMIGAIGRVKSRGCTTPDRKSAQKDGLVMHCPSHLSYAACLSEFSLNGKRYCRLELPPSQRLPVGDSALATGLGGIAGSVLPMRFAVGFEGEGLSLQHRYHLRGGELSRQKMKGFGRGWSDNRQLFWHGGETGSTLDLMVEVPRDGAWRVAIDLTRAPDYGQLEFEVDHQPSAIRFDGYAPAVQGPETVDLGVFTLHRGLRPVTLRITGRNGASSGFFAGVDRIRLQAR